MSGQFDYDVFLSHNSQDKPAVRELAERLKGDGLRVWLDEWVIRPGDSIPLAIEQGLERSRTLILFMSRNAFASDWVTLERHTALFRDPTSQQRRFVPLLLEDCEISDTLRQFAYVDWRGRDQKQYERLLAVCGGRAAGEEAEEPSAAEEAKHAQPRQSRAVSLGHTGWIRSVALSNDGRQALSGSDDNTLRLWDLDTGNCVKILQGHTDEVNCVVLSNDGTLALSGSDDNTLRLWDLDSGNCIKTLQGHTGMVWSVDLSNDGSLALSGSADKTLRVWDLDSGSCIKTLQGYAGIVWSVALSNDGTRAVSGSDDNTLRLWHLDTGVCVKTFQGHTGIVRGVALSDGGTLALSGSDDKTLRVWDLDSGNCIKTLRGHTARVWSVALSNDGSQALSSSSDKTLRLWDLDSGNCIKTLQGHSDYVRSVALNADSTRALSSSSDNTLRLWDLGSGNCIETLQGHTDEINCVALSNDGTRAISGSDDNSVRLWDLGTGNCLKDFQGHTDEVNCVALSNDGALALSGSDDNALRLWNSNTGKCLKILEGHTASVWSVAFSDDGVRALSGSDDKTLRLWDLGTGNCIKVLQGHTDYVRSVVLSNDGTRALSGSDDNTVRLWDLDTGNCVKTLQGHTNEVNCVALSNDGTRALSGSVDRTLRLWNLDTGNCIKTLEGHTKHVRSVAFSADGTHTLSGSDDNTLRLWDLREGICIETFKGHTESVISVAFSIYEGENVVYSAAINGLLRIWQIEPLSDAEKGAIDSEATQYTNAKVLLVGDSGVGKSALRIRLTEDRFEPATASTDAHETVKADWATQVKLPQGPGKGEVDQEIWLWDFAGQADYRLIHQLFMDETALAVLVFNPQSQDPFDGLGQWDRDLTRAARREFAKLLVAGRCDRGRLMVSRQSARDFARRRGYARYLETSAMSGENCEALRDAIVETIDWGSIPWTTSPRIFKLLKDEILRLRKEGKVLLRMGELKQQLELRLPKERFSLEQLRAVVGLLAGPGLVWQLEFGDIVLLQPEWINKYAAAVIRSVREIGEIGVIHESEVLSGKLDYTMEVVDASGEKVETKRVKMVRLEDPEEAIILRAMHQIFVDHGLCVRETVEGNTQLVLPSYVKRELPSDPGHPPVLMTYRFNGHADNIYATLVVQLRQTRAFENGKLWRYAADFECPRRKRMGLKMERKEEGAAEISVYFDPGVGEDMKVTFIKYVHEHLLEKAKDVLRLRRFACSHCGHPVHDVEMARTILREAGKDAEIRCQNWKCDKRFSLWDLIEQKFASKEFQERVRKLEELAKEAIDSESKELILVGHAFTIAGEAGQIYRGYTNSDHGIDGEIEFKDREGKASGKRLYLQLKSGDSYLKKRKRDGAEIFSIKKARWADYWQQQAYPVMLVIRTSDGEIRWMDVSRYLKEEGRRSDGQVKQIVFEGEPFTAMTLRRWRERLIPFEG